MKMAITIVNSGVPCSTSKVANHEAGKSVGRRTRSVANSELPGVSYSADEAIVRCFRYEEPGG